MTKVSDFPEGYDVNEFIESCRAPWHTPLEPPEEIPQFKTINGIQHRLVAWTEISDTRLIKKDMETIKRLSGAHHVVSVKIGKRFQCVYMA